MNKNHIASSMLLYSLGDAWGYVTEFKTFEQIVDNAVDIPEQLIISDDTQMSLYTLQALQYFAAKGGDVEKAVQSASDENPCEYINILRKHIAEQYEHFYFDNDNNRAPGMTVMSAMESYITSFPRKTGKEGGDTNYSLGCGTIMRAPWIGLLGYSREAIVSIAVIQAQVTHGDPRGWLVSAISALLVKDIAEGNIIRDHKDRVSVFVHVDNIIEEIQTMNSALYPAIRYISYDCMAIDNVQRKIRHYDNNWNRIKKALGDDNDFSKNLVDINNFFGGGWIATEALYNALGAYQIYADKDVFNGIKRLVYTNGDSDSIAAIGGAMLGAQHIMPEDCQQSILGSLEERYRNEIVDTIDFISSTH